MPKKSSPKKQRKILVWESDMNYLPYSIYMTDSPVDEAFSCIENGRASITVGGCGIFPSVAESVKHELDEVFLMINDCRLVSSKDVDCLTTSDCVFHMDHRIFQKMEHYTTFEFVELMPRLYDIWCGFNGLKKEKSDGIIGNHNVQQRGRMHSKGDSLP